MSGMTRRLVFVVVVLVLASMVAACAVPQAPAEQEAPEAAEAGEAPVEIVLWHMEQPPHRVERIQTLIT